MSVQSDASSPGEFSKTSLSPATKPSSPKIPSQKTSPVVSDIPAEIPIDTLKQIPDKSDVNFNEEVKMVLLANRDKERLPTPVKQIHEVVVRALEEAGKSAVSEFIALGNQLEKLQKRVDDFATQTKDSKKIDEKLLHDIIENFESIAKEVNDLKADPSSLRGTTTLLAHLDRMRQQLFKSLPRDLATRSAVSEGKAAFDSRQTIQELHEEGIPLTGVGVSAQEIFLPHGHPGMFKKGVKRAEWEEKTVPRIMSFFAPEAVLGAYQYKDLRSHRRGDAPPAELYALQQGYSITSDELTDRKMKNKVLSKIKNPQMLELAKQLTVDQQYFNKFNEIAYEYQDATGKPVTVSFTELLEKFRDHTITVQTNVREKVLKEPGMKSVELAEKEEKASWIPLKHYGRSNPGFKEALSVFSTLPSEYIKQQQCYNRFKDKTFVLKHKDGSLEKISFSQLKWHFWKEEITDEVEIQLSSGEPFLEEDFFRAINFNPKDILSQLPYFSPDLKEENLTHKEFKGLSYELRSSTGQIKTLTYDQLKRQIELKLIPADTDIRSVTKSRKLKDISKVELTNGPWEYYDTKQKKWETLSTASLKTILENFSHLPYEKRFLQLRKFSDFVKVSDPSNSRLMTFFNRDLEKSKKKPNWTYLNSKGKWCEIGDFNKFQLDWAMGKIPSNTLIRSICTEREKMIPPETFTGSWQRLIEGSWITVPKEEATEIFNTTGPRDILFLRQISLPSKAKDHLLPMDELLKESNASKLVDLLPMDQLYPMYESLNWAYRDESNQWKTISFKELQTLWLTGKIKPDQDVVFTSRRADKKSVQVKDLDPSGVSENSFWKYYDSQDLQYKIVDTKTLFSLPGDTKVINMGEPSKIGASKNLIRALDVSWKLTTHQLFKNIIGNTRMTPLENIAGKSFAEMTPFRELFNSQPVFLNYLMRNLSPQEQFKINMTGALAFQDLHGANIGISAKITPDEHQELLVKYPDFHTKVPALENFEKNRFSYTYTTFDGIKVEEVNVPFQKFQDDFQKDNIKGNTVLEVITPTVTKTQISLNDQAAFKEGVEMVCDPLVQKGLHPETTIILFDTDLVLGEDNDFTLLNKQYTDQSKLESYLPIRSAFLGIPFEDQPVSAEALQLIREGSSPKGREEMNHWAIKSEAPFRNFLPKNQSRLNSELSEIFSQEQYSLSYHRKRMNSDQVTIETIGKQFFEEYSEINGKNQPFWDRLQKDLADEDSRLLLKNPPQVGYFSYIIKESDLAAKDSLEDFPKILAGIAENHHLTVEELLKLNGGGISLEAGTRLIVRPPLNTSTPESQKERAKIIPQLVPNITFHQKLAFNQREDRVSEYLSHYDKLSGLTIGDTEDEIVKALALLEEITQSSATPLNSIEMTKVTKDFERIKNARTNPDIPLIDIQQAFIQLQKLLTDLYRPSYSRLNSVRFPFLADNNELNKMLKQIQLEGNAIGLLDCPIEYSLEAASKKGKKEVGYLLASRLQKRLEAKAKEKGEPIPWRTGKTYEECHKVFKDSFGL